MNTPHFTRILQMSEADKAEKGIDSRKRAIGRHQSALLDARVQDVLTLEERAESIRTKLVDPNTPNSEIKGLVAELDKAILEATFSRDALKLAKDEIAAWWEDGVIPSMDINQI